MSRSSSKVVATLLRQQLLEQLLLHGAEDARQRSHQPVDLVRVRARARARARVRVRVGSAATSPST